MVMTTISDSADDTVRSSESATPYLEIPQSQDGFPGARETNGRCQ